MTIAPATEFADARYDGLDTWPDEVVLAALLDGQRRALEAVAAAIPDLCRGARLAAERLRAGGRLIYVAAGSPALMSLADALEIPQTYGIDHERIVTILADGKGIAERLDGSREDRADEAEADLAAARVGPADCIIATSASGRTPYTLAGLRAARRAGAATIGIAGNPNTPLLESAEVAVLLATGPEVIAGSTRMGAGTAQKAALNMLSTLMGVHLGHVYDGLMVNVKADNAKLRGRAARIVSKIAGVDDGTAVRALEASGGEVKPAALIAAGVRSLAEAGALLGQSRGNLRQALARASTDLQA